jgi:aminocarboxymuconate-semialdehyde decarboxylase
MARLAFGGVFDRCPSLKVITHHAGGLVPFFHKRNELAWHFNEQLLGYTREGAPRERPPLDLYRRFYCDTAIQGNPSALMCAHEFFGADHMVFATDTPYDNEYGERVYRETIAGVDAMPISAAAREQIYEGNARRLFRLRQSAA